MGSVYCLRTEYLDKPLGIDAEAPRLSWKLHSDKKNVIQKNYRIYAYENPTKQGLIWDSGVKESQQSIAVFWKGPKLRSCQRVFWKVQIELIDYSGNKENVESKLTWFEMGLLEKTDWKAKWIEPEEKVEIDENMPAPYLRKTFSVKKELEYARIYQTSHGLYEFWINGEIGCQDKFKPGFTSYYKRIQYQAYDITNLLILGENCLAVILGDGWWRGTTGGAYRNNFGYKLAYLGQICLKYKDGTEEWIISDETFQTSTGGFVKNYMKFGELYDANLEPEGWKQSNYNTSKWKQVHLEQDDFAAYDNLIASRGLPVREFETFLPIIRKTPNGETLLDYGQNIAGYIRMHLHSLTKGQSVILRHGEALDEEGNFTIKNLSVDQPDAKIQQIEYIAGEESEIVYCPILAVFGFQYVVISGYTNEINPEDFKAIAVYSAMENTGEFSCSNQLINQLVSNSRWSQKGNFLDVPTDCPTRERSPWCGDSQIFAKTAADFTNVYPFFEKWMADVAAEQFESGKVPNIVPMSASIHNKAELSRKQAKIDAIPDTMIIKTVYRMTLGTIEEGGTADGSAGWGDTAVITPYIMYLCYGDKEILRRQYESAKKWVDYMIHQAANKSERYCDMPWYAEEEDSKYIWDTGFHFGEWCEPDREYADQIPFITLLKNPDYRTATMYLYYSTFLFTQIATILEMKEIAESYRKIADEVKRVFNKYLIPEDGEIEKGWQAQNVRALAFGLCDKKHETTVIKRLVEMLRENGYKLNTGFLSTPYILPVLVEHGYVNEAYRVLEQTECPGWLYNVKAGATTILENWDGFVKCAASFNHYSYGAVCDFLFQYVTGICPLLSTPGYKHFKLKPVIGGSLTKAVASYDSGYGLIESKWEKCEDRIEYEFTIPVNTTALICLPGRESMTVGSGTWRF